MRIEDIIRIIDNREYISIEKGENNIGSWYILETENDRIVLVYDKVNELYEIYVFEMNGIKEKNFWQQEYGTNGYYIFQNIYNGAEKEYCRLENENIEDIRLSRNDLELVLIALGNINKKDREKYVEVYNKIIFQLNN